MSDSAPDRFNYSLRMVCKDCSCEFEIEEFQASKHRGDHGERYVAMCIPNECADCRNLRVIQGEKE